MNAYMILLFGVVTCGSFATAFAVWYSNETTRLSFLKFHDEWNTRFLTSAENRHIDGVKLKRALAEVEHYKKEARDANAGYSQLMNILEKQAVKKD